ncbi:MAG TPA: peptidoglycan DD-metalloendopeptidase family protein [Pyrinomonadaceae bacterium]|nr:peptidoglycan DD-metalloendopeptidase family protein [Pyrinomonadaceae bacterium]
MNRDERLYAFIISRTSRSRARIRRFAIRQSWVKLSAFFAAVLFCAAAYGLYGVTQQVAHMRIEAENERLRRENERQRQQLQHLENRVDAIEDASRRLSEMSGVETQGEEEGTNPHGAGGPFLSADDPLIASVEVRTALLEQDLKAVETALRERARVPSVWPTEGETTDSYGMRGNPFGGGASEFHAGQDISAPRGTPVVAAASGTIREAGWQNGYGNVVIIDHGDGLSTRYGHLSKIETEQGKEVTRGERIGQVGSTGRSTGPHLHYEVRINEVPVSPRRYLPERQ